MIPYKKGNSLLPKKIMKFFSMLIIMISVLTIFASSAIAASTFNEIIRRFYKGFKHIGTIEHEHFFSSDDGSAGFTAMGLGLAGGGHDAWSTRSENRRTFNSDETYMGYTARGALPELYMGIVSTYELTRGYSSTIGLLLKPNELGRIKQTVSSATEPGKGSYTKQSSKAENTGGTTKIQSSGGGASTNIEVEGYSKHWEVVIVETGGTKTGWWDLP